MKPPLVKLRVGELYGRRDNELLGFIQTINYMAKKKSNFEQNGLKNFKMNKNMDFKMRI